MFAEVGKEELEGDGGGSGPDVQVSVVAKVSTSVFRSVHIEQFARFWELLNGEFKPFRVGKIHEIFSSS